MMIHFIHRRNSTVKAGGGSFPAKARFCGLAPIALLFGLLFLAATGRAQTPADDQVSSAQTGPGITDLGYPHESRQFIRAYLTAAQLYDGNLYADGARRSGDSFTVLSPRVTWDRMTRSTQWSLSYAPDVRRYARFSNLNTITQDGAVAFESRNSAHFKWGFSDHFFIVPDAASLNVRPMTRSDDPFGPPKQAVPSSLTSPTDLMDPTFGPTASPVITGRTRRLYNQSRLRGEYTFDPRTTLNVEGGFAQLRFSRPDLTPLNQVSLEASFLRQQTARRTLILTYRFSHFDFAARAAAAANQRVMVGMATKLTSTLSADFQAGPSVSTNGVQRVMGWDARLGMEKTLAHMRWRAGYARYLGSSGGLSSATRNQSVLASVAMDLGRHTALELSATYSSFQSVFNRQLNLHGLFLSASLESAINRHMRWFLSYQRINQSRYAYADPALSYDRVALGLRLFAPLYHD